MNGPPRNKHLKKLPRCASNMHEPALGEHIHYLGCILNGSSLRQICDNRRQGVKHFLIENPEKIHFLPKEHLSKTRKNNDLLISFIHVS